MKFSNRIRAVSARAYTAAVLVPSTLLLSTMARAADGDPISQMLDAIALGGVSAKVIAAGLLIVAIALAFKSPQLGKRVVKQV